MSSIPSPNGAGSYIVFAFRCTERLLAMVGAFVIGLFVGAFHADRWRGVQWGLRSLERRIEERGLSESPDGVDPERWDEDA